MKKLGYTHRYSLADYQVAIKVPSIGNIAEETYIIGGPGANGEGSCTGQITVSRNTALWSTEGDATGSWVHKKNLDKTGTCSIQIKQVSNAVLALIGVCNAYESVQSKSEKGITITINPSINDDLVTNYITCNDCRIVKVPDQNFSEDVDSQNWEFTCGQVLFSTEER